MRNDGAKKFYKSKYFHLAVCATLLVLAALILLPFGRSKNHSGHDIRYHLSVIRALSAAWDKGSFLVKLPSLSAGITAMARVCSIRPFPRAFAYFS